MTLTECTVSPHEPLPHLQRILVLCYYSIPNIDHFGLTSMYLFMPGVRVHVCVHVHVHIHVHVLVHAAYSCSIGTWTSSVDMDMQFGNENLVWTVNRHTDGTWTAALEWTCSLDTDMQQGHVA
jgi:hypothetical protein